MSRARFAFLLAIFPAALAAQTSDSTRSQWPPLKVVDLHWMDTTVSACTDFNQFANGGFLAHDTIPAAYASSGVGRDMDDRNQAVVRAVLEDAASHRNAFPPTATPRKLGTFYATCMDSTAVEAAGARPIKQWLRGVRLVRGGTRHGRPQPGRGARGARGCRLASRPGCGR